MSNTKYVVVVIPFSFEEGKAIFNLGYTDIRPFMIYNNLGRCIDVITAAENINKYIPTETFEGYLGIGIDKGHNPDGNYIMFSYNENAGFEPFTPDMPSPEYPSTIRNVGDNGSADIKVQNKNWFNINNAFKYGPGNDQTVINSDGTITTTSNYSNMRNKGTLLRGLEKNTDYIISLEGVSMETTSNQKYVSIEVLKAGTSSIIKQQTFLKIVGEKISMTFNTGNNTDISVHISGFYNTSVAGIFIYKNVQIEKDLIATDYVPHEEQILHFPLTKILHKDDYLAEDGIHYKRKTIVFDGTEAWFKSSTALVNRFGLTTSKANNFKGINSDNTLCTHFKYDERNRITINAYHFLNSNALYFDTDMENVTTLEEWKSYLAEQYANGTPVTLEYGLVEEIVEEYTAEQQEAYNKLKQLYSYEDVTHITCENDITCNFNVEHFKDYNILRQNDKQELQAQIDEIKASLTSEVSE